MAFKMAEGYVELSQRGFGGVGGAIAKLKRGLLSLINPMNAVAGAMAAIGAGFGVRSLLKLGSDAEEVDSKFQVVFRNVSKEAQQTAKDLKKYLGASTTEVKKSLAEMGDLFKPLGFADDEALQLSSTMTRLAADLSSFNNMSMDEAMRRLQGTLVGSHENALKFGVVINENVLKAKMAEQGADKLTGAAFEQAKVYARLTLLMEGTSDAQGDLGRTSGSFANSMRRMGSTLKELGETVGKILMPIFKGFGNIVSAIAEKTNAFVGGQLPELQQMLSTVKGILDGIAESIRSSSFTGWSKQLSEAFSDAGKILITTIEAIGRFLLAVAVQVGQLIGEGIIAAMVATAPGGEVIGEKWKQMKRGFAVMGARLGGSTGEEARREGFAAVEGKGRSPMKALALAASESFGKGSELDKLFGELSKKYVGKSDALPAEIAKVIKFAIPAKAKDTPPGVDEAAAKAEGPKAAIQDKLVGRFGAEDLVSKMQNAAFKAMEKKDDPNRELVKMAQGEGIPVRIGKANGGGEQAAAAAAWG